MTEPVRNQYDPDEVSPPGETLQEILDDRGMTQAELATRTGRPKKTINEIIQGKAAITPETALQLERVLKVPADFWVNRENHYRANLARREESKRLAECSSWARQFPLKAMIAHEWLKPVHNDTERVREVLQYFGVASPSAWDQSWSKVEVVFRRSIAATSTWHALAAWLRAGEFQVNHESTRPFDGEHFLEVLRDVRRLTVEMPEDFATRLQKTCADAGVVVAFVPELPKAPVSGATRWIGPDRPLLQLSLRYKSDDQFWFSFFHEACHLLRHGRKQVFLDFGTTSEDPQEKEADKFAAETLIPESSYQQFVLRTHFTKAAITRFAQEIGIGAGIVVGRLQRDRHLPFSHCNDLKHKLDWHKKKSERRNA
jgi:HTH-type transcriptional regulator/antitoxin HigA